MARRKKPERLGAESAAEKPGRRAEEAAGTPEAGAEEAADHAPGERGGETIVTGRRDVI